MSGSTLVAPLLISEPFGTSAANPTYIKLPIPVASQIATTVNAASFTDGFPPSTMTPAASGGLPMFGQDLNGILWMITAYCANFAAGALSPYNATLSAAISGYPLGAVLVNTAGNGLWVNTTNGNTTNPDAGGAGWSALAVSGAEYITLSNANVTLSAGQTANSVIIFQGAITANIVVTLTAAEPGGSWVFVNNCTGAYTVSVQWSGGGGAVGVSATGPGTPTSVYCAPAGLFNTGVNTSGLAPLASPALTGVPTAPTAAAATNTTQIATTAMVQAAIILGLTPYATKASPTFTGTPAAPTPGTSDNTTRIATTAYVQAVVASYVTSTALASTLAAYALLSGPTFTGVPKAPTASAGTNTTQIATTAFVQAATANNAANPIVKRGFVSLANGANTVNFATAFPTLCDAVVMGAYGAGAAYYVTSVSASGFTCNVGVTEDYYYIATGY